MHERAVMTDLMRRIEEVARAEGASRVVSIGVRLGALSHFTPQHFREHFADASRGTLAEGATVDALVDGEVGGEQASDVVLETVRVEIPETEDGP